MVNSTRLGIIADELSFETGCLVYHPFERVAGEIFQIAHIVPSLVK